MRDPFEVYSSTSRAKTPRPLDWDETAADSQSAIEGVHDEERVMPRLDWIRFVVLAVFVVLAARLFYLQIVKGEEFREMSENNRVRKQTVLAPRGKILDRYGQVLAQNTASFNLVAIPFDIPKEGFDSELAALAQDFKIDSQEVARKIKSVAKGSVDPVLIKQDISQQEAILFETKASEYVGFSVQEIPIRQYPDPEIFSHILGYTGIISPGDLTGKQTENYDTFDFIGKLGIEAEYEDFLHGRNGESLVEVDATGKLLSVLGEKRPVPGQTAVLNIDQGLQKVLYEKLRGRLGSQKGAAVALDPKTGKVLALISVPGYDNNLFAHGIKAEDYRALLSDKNQPLFNRAVSGAYPPGSTVKPMVALAALQESVVEPETKIVDRGVLVIPNQYDPKVSYNFYGWKREGLGPMDVRTAIAQSSDIYFYTVGGGHPNSPIKGLGAEKLAGYYRKFNLGKVTGIDIQGEKPGLVADPDWKARYFADDAVLKKWYLGDTYHISIGQGDMLATPLQVAEWTAIIANNGIGIKPRLLNKIIDQTGEVVFETEQEILVRDFADPRLIKVVQEGMRLTVTDGSGRQLSSLPITSAGKTGTSQFDGSDPSRTHAWYTAYAPFEDPRIVITVLVEAGGEGHSAAVPVVKDALEWWWKNRGPGN